MNEKLIKFWYHSDTLNSNKDVYSLCRPFYSSMVYTNQLQNYIAVHEYNSYICNFHKSIIIMTAVMPWTPTVLEDMVFLFICVFFLPGGW